MRMNCIKFDRLIPWLGIALVAGGVSAAATYLNFERKSRSSEISLATLDRLIHDLQLTAALKKIHNGEVAGAAQNLDLLLCGDILLTNAELPTADPDTRALVQNAFRTIARARPRTEGTDTGPTREHIVDQLAAERILSLALAAPSEVEPK
jgi:hypothetical protein